MFCRAKIGVALFLAGTLTGWATPLNSEEINPAQSRDGLISPVVIKPAKTKSSIGTGARWRGSKPLKIIHPPQSAVVGKKVERSAGLQNDPNPLAQPAITPVSTPASTRFTSESEVVKK